MGSNTRAGHCAAHPAATFKDPLNFKAECKVVQYELETGLCY